MKTTLYMMKETSPYLLGLVIVTEQNRCVVIDGGRPEDMPLLRELVAGRPIEAWLLTHPHTDHISGLLSELEKNGGADFDIRRVYHHFPDYDAWLSRADEAPDRDYFLEELNEALPDFNRLKGKLGARLMTLEEGDCFSVDELSFEVLYTAREGLFANPMNDASTVFKITTPRKTLLIMGDLGPDAGDILYRESRHKLKSDIVQMAHHGHMNPSMEVYAAIAPEACLWSAPLWLYNEPEVPHYLADTEKLTRMKRLRMHGSAVTRAWMDILGVKKHYVSGEGTQTVEL